MSETKGAGKVSRPWSETKGAAGVCNLCCGKGWVVIHERYYNDGMWSRDIGPVPCPECNVADRQRELARRGEAA